jgi:transcription initiation factor TFIIIB Brf1 subunit/transcription initiation factor TFIIB
MDKTVYPANGFCPECKSKNIKKDTRKGEDFCGDCGFVIRERKWVQQGNKQSSGCFRHHP